MNAPVRVTVGMPVYNGVQTLRPVLESIVNQSYKPFRLIISDNASTDATESICREFADADSRIVYIRQPQNIGAGANFDFVLAEASTEYFMWAASDDIHSPDFLEKNVEFLDRNSDFLDSTCPVRFESGEYNATSMGDETRDEADRFERILKFFDTWHANGRFYSLFRTDRLKKARAAVHISCLGGDWILVIELLNQGKLKRLDSGSLELSRGGVSNSLDAFSKFRFRAINWIIPLFDISMHVARLFKAARLQQKLKMTVVLLKLNAMAFKFQLRFELKKRYLRLRRTGALTAS